MIKVSLYREKQYYRLYIKSSKIKSKNYKPRILQDCKPFINELQKELNDKFNDCLDFSRIKNHVDFFINTKIKKTASIFDYQERFIEHKIKKYNRQRNKPISNETILKYINSLDNFREYLKIYYNSFLPNVIGQDCLDYFYNFLIKKKKLSENTAARKHKEVKHYLRFLTDNNLNIDKRYNLSNFNQHYDHLIYETSNDQALTPEKIIQLIELRKRLKQDDSIIPQNFNPYFSKKVIDKQYRNKRKNIKLVLDCFLWMVSTGMYYNSDIRKNVKIKIHGKMLSYKRGKNNSNCEGIPVVSKELFIVPELINEYAIKSNFPCNLSEHIVRKHLKTISELIDAPFTITAKTGRKTFATIMYHHYNLDLKLVSDMLGHKNQEVTRHYLRLPDTERENAILTHLNSKN